MHPTETTETGLTHRKYEYLKRYVHEVDCVAVGEICVDHVRAMQNKGRDQQAEVFAHLYTSSRQHIHAL